jgi:hypothetical protein
VQLMPNLSPGFRRKVANVIKRPANPPKILCHG